MIEAAPSLGISTREGVMPLAFARFVEVSTGWNEARLAEFDSEVIWGEALSQCAELPGAVLHLNLEGRRQKSAVIGLDTVHGPACALLAAWGGEWDLTVSGASPAAADGALAALSALIPPRPKTTDAAVDLWFWMAHPMAGAVSRRKEIPRLPFASIEGNYPLSVRTAAAQLADLTEPPSGGRLLVFHGPPGTGKTRFLQSLSDAWSGWCDFHYIVDPEEMFSTALYLNTVLLDGDSDVDRWRLIVIEDGDEFIDANAKARVGQGVSRLLNVADGLIGSGLRVMVLISTNVPSMDFGAAIVRSGRCGALVEFPAFPAAEATQWTADHGIDVGFDEPVTLADLYAFTRT